MLTKMVDGVEIICTPEEEAQIRSRWAAWDKEQASTQWLRDRQEAYPAIVDQLDQIYHDGLDAWKATIKEIKDAYPKPSN